MYARWSMLSCLGETQLFVHHVDHELFSSVTKPAHRERLGVVFSYRLGRHTRMRKH